MENLKTGSTPTEAEVEFNALKSQGDDFFRIELLRQARNFYEKALARNPESTEVKALLDQCNKMLGFENRVVWILLGSTAVVIAVTLLFL